MPNVRRAVAVVSNFLFEAGTKNESALSSNSDLLLVTTLIPQCVPRSSARLRMAAIFSDNGSAVVQKTTLTPYSSSSAECNIGTIGGLENNNNNNQESRLAGGTFFLPPFGE